ncbi:bifunctional protein-serine/threonine kinase/phosphatase [Aquabacterium sp. A7-Y]|uniref:bifunctional protein-serine/threonine kinase/phosphatase n=1 Tax=Aquabacterium sp. A7-Y TaxID=1349605 RepID=UPI00223E2F57|nr:bifunctional protein-serine/threonine kinase/phosphatase [Aquabacterium sp. A7-Y]MCW7540434.1 bifunctional protein-serine/threonine kinase/phosphatase [Aquabacterium sp. A7-Y]
MLTLREAARPFFFDSDMSNKLRISVGQHSDKGRKEVNQDFYGVSVPKEPLLSSKGIAIALADGIGSSSVSQIASEFAVMGFLDDYYCTSDAWSVKKAVERVLTATNSWLHSRTQQSPYRYDQDRGYVCALSALVLKSTTAHVFHVGDTRIYRLHGGALEQLTQDHRVRVAEGRSYLSRAVGFKPQIEIDYQALQVEKGDVFLLASDGVYEHLDAAFLAAAVQGGRGDLDRAARSLVEEAYQRGSADNLTVQIVVIDELPSSQDAREIHRQLSELPLPPILEARTVVDGYRIVREVHGSSRSHIYLAVDIETDGLVILKTPSVDLQADPAYLERFLMEEWVARRINSAHVLKPCRPTRERSCLYVATEFIDGQTLAQWMIDNPRPDLETVRGIVEQIAKGLQAFHRLEMLHQDLRPENIVIDKTGTVKIIDFGATSVAGITEMASPLERTQILGTAQYTAPEYFLGEAGSARSDLFSLGVMTYQMLSGRLPYGVEVAKARTLSAQRKLHYESVLDENREIPVWIDAVLRKAVHPDPLRRYEALSEFVYDLRHPNKTFFSRARPPLIERHPVLFWKSLSAILAIALFVSLLVGFGMP